MNQVLSNPLHWEVIITPQGHKPSRPLEKLKFNSVNCRNGQNPNNA